MKLQIFLLLFTLGLITARQYDWDAWSERLNQRIDNQVRRSTQGLDTLGERIDAQVRNNLRGLDHLGEQINAQVQNNLKGLDNLGNRISQQVYEGLRPVREMQAMFRIRFGEQGTTVATYKDRVYIIRDGVKYVCSGTISETDGSCSGTLTRAVVKDKQDFCYFDSKSSINNWYCIGNGNVNFSYVNGKYFCGSMDGSPTLLISSDQYRNLCGDMNVSYKYFSNTPLGEYGSNIICSGSRPYVCTMTDNNYSNSVNSVIISGK